MNALATASYRLLYVDEAAAPLAFIHYDTGRAVLDDEIYGSRNVHGRLFIPTPFTVYLFYTPAVHLRRVINARIMSFVFEMIRRMRYDAI